MKKVHETKFTVTFESDGGDWLIVINKSQYNNRKSETIGSGFYLNHAPADVWRGSTIETELRSQFSKL
jgi:hypothetical protein